jgi:hypothetical protein
MLEPTLVKNEMICLQKHFRVGAASTDPNERHGSGRTNTHQDKRDYVVQRLREMGFVINTVPDSTFYL